MPRPGLLVKSILLILLVFAAAFAAVRALYMPWLEERVRSQMSEVADECLTRSEDILRRRAQHIEFRVGRTLEDLPYELVAGDARKIRSLVASYAEDLRRTWSGNVAVLTREFRRRTETELRARSARLAAEYRRDATTGLLLLLGAVLGLTGLALTRTVLAPLGRLLRGTERVAAGDLDHPVGVIGGDEVGRLGSAFDRMTDALRTSREEIRGLNRTLEDKVREKTRALEERNEELKGANERLTATVDELTRTKDALVHSETMASLGTLAGGVAHEFNNLLGGIIGCAEEAAGEEDPAEVRAALGMILRTAQRACNITENLLRFSRPPARVARPVEISRVVADALDLVRIEATKRRVQLEESLEELPLVPLDSGQIHQVLLNLLTNGLHAVRDGGKLRVSVGREGEQALVRVEDDGPGVSPEDRLRIFDPFYTTRERGTGLGLSVSWSIVHSHGGTLRVDRSPLGGARFEVRLPINQAEE